MHRCQLSIWKPSDESVWSPDSRTSEPVNTFRYFLRQCNIRFDNALSLWMHLKFFESLSFSLLQCSITGGGLESFQSIVNYRQTHSNVRQLPISIKCDAPTAIQCGLLHTVEPTAKNDWQVTKGTAKLRNKHSNWAPEQSSLNLRLFALCRQRWYEPLHQIETTIAAGSLLDHSPSEQSECLLETAITLRFQDYSPLDCNPRLRCWLTIGARD